MRFLIIALSILTVFKTGFGQNNDVNCFIITNELDTVYGKIQHELKPGFGSIKFIDETSKKRKFYPRQIKGFVLNDTIEYRSILQTENAEAAEYHIFALLIKDGALRLLATRNKTGSFFNSKSDEPKKNEYNFYIQEPGTGKFYKLPRLSYRTQLADRIGSNKALRREVLNKVYSYEEIPEVIKKFNSGFADEK